MNFEVDNVDKVYDELKQFDQIDIQLDIKSENFGQRHFIIKGPQEMLVDIIEVITPSENYIDNYEKSLFLLLTVKPHDDILIFSVDLLQLVSKV